MKATSDAMLDEIAPGLSTYLMSGNLYDLTSFSKKIDPYLNIDNIEKLLRVHFVLTRSDDTRVGVLDFVEQLGQRLRRVKTTVRLALEDSPGEVRGRVRWNDTVTRRCNRNPKDYTLLVCDTSERCYDIPENLVLKSLLQIIHRTVYHDLAVAFEYDYEWISEWTRETELRDTLDRLLLRNVYLRKIDLSDVVVTDRMISRAANSRVALYRDAAALLSRYRGLMSYSLDPTEARELLINTFIRPEATSVLFELYWTIKIIQEFTRLADVRLRLLEPGSRTVASWQHGGYEYRIYHDSTAGFRFRENTERLGGILKDSDNYLGRALKALRKLTQLTGVRQDLWAKRPDIILEKRAADNRLVSVLVAEVKYTDDRAYAIQGLRELLEYMALIRDQGGYIERYDDLFGALKKVRGCLFLAGLAEPFQPDPDVQVLVFGDDVNPLVTSDLQTPLSTTLAASGGDG